jgi:hypothetical protein
VSDVKSFQIATINTTDPSITIALTLEVILIIDRYFFIYRIITNNTNFSTTLNLNLVLAFLLLIQRK